MNKLTMIRHHIKAILLRFLEKIKKDKLEIILFAILIIIGIFLRSYKFSDWLHFEIDQSFDTVIVSDAVENGIGNLPLLGPTAGGGRSLRLGPAFYYMEYLSAKIFGNTPTGHAMLVLIFSILSLPLFYIFIRRYFSRLISLLLLSLFSLSLYMILYGRFSWSPNVLPFLILLTFYTLLRGLSQEKNKVLWLIISATLLVIVTQIHFNAFFVIPAIFLPILIIHRKKISPRICIGALLIFIIFYSPVIISDIKTNGENFRYFIKKIEKSSGDKNGSLDEKIIRTANYYASECLFIITGLDHINGRVTGYGFSSKKHGTWRIGALISLILSLFILLKNLKEETNPKRKDFLWLITFWFLASFIYFFFLIKGGVSIRPRFFLIIAPLSFILLGFIFEKIETTQIRKGSFAIIAVTIFFIATNAYGLNLYFSRINQVDKETISVKTEDIFPNTGRVTLAQQYAIVDYVESIYLQNNYPVYFQAKHEYEPAIWYHLEKKGIDFYSRIRLEKIYSEGNYFVMEFSEKDIAEFSDTFSILEIKNFGALTVFHLTPKPEAVTGVRQNELEKETSAQKSKLNKLITWNNLFTKKTD